MKETDTVWMKTVLMYILLYAYYVQYVLCLSGRSDGKIDRGFKDGLCGHGSVSVRMCVCVHNRVCIPVHDLPNYRLHTHINPPTIVTIHGKTHVARFGFKIF